MDLNSPSTSSVGKPIARDRYCWKCHTLVKSNGFECNKCIRIYHKQCPATRNSGNRSEQFPTSGRDGTRELRARSQSGVCLVCLALADETSTQDRPDILRSLLKEVVIDLKENDSNKWFHQAVDTNIYTDYLDLIVNPMDLNQLQHKVRSGRYASTASFLADVKWVITELLNAGISRQMSGEGSFKGV